MTVKTQAKLTDLEALAEAAECLRTLAHPHRLRIVQMLLGGRIPWGNWPRLAEFPATWPRSICG